MISEEKRLLRAKLKNRREAMTLGEREELSGQIASRLTCTPEFLGSETVLCFVSTDIEVDTTAIMTSTLLNGKRLAVPRCLPGRLMEFGVVRSLDELVVGAYGIKEPPAGCETVSAEDTADAMCVLPGLSFDKQGYRLGFGGGYYDRFLPQFRGISCGICYESFVLAQLPRGKYDRSADMLITEKKTIRFAF